MWMQNEMSTLKEIWKKKKKKPKTTAFYLVSSIQYDVSDTMHVTKLGTKKNKEKKIAAYSHKVVTQFQLYEKK